MSSESEPSYQEPDYENLSRNIITEVKKRPALYDQRLTEYNNKHDRKKLWQEVYRSIFKGWDQFTEKQQNLQGDMVQKKWKNIKDSFLKELSHYGKGKTHKKKRKYIHYDSLLFLLPTLQKKKFRTLSDIEARTESIPSTPTRSQERTQPENNCSRGSTDHKIYEEEDIDEEKHFALMLVPMLRKLNDDQKHYAKVEILNVLHKARNYAIVWPAGEDVRVDQLHQLKVGRGDRSDVLTHRTSANGSDEEGGQTRVKEEIDFDEMTDES